MASKKTKQKQKLSSKEKQTFLTGFDLDKYIPLKYQVALFTVIILLLFLYFFSPIYFGGKTFQSGDIITSKSITTYAEQHSDGFTLWNPYIFGGMPAYAITVGWKGLGHALSSRVAVTGILLLIPVCVICVS